MFPITLSASKSVEKRREAPNKMTLWNVEWFSEKAEQVRRRTWLPWGHKKYPRRAILKDGHKNVCRRKMAQLRWWRYLRDIFTTLMDAQWRWTLQFLALEFFGCWLSFALIWWLIAFVHGDLQEDHLPLRQAETGWTPCILNIHGFHSAFLYSLETQHTTGYGLRVITEECPEAIFILVCQCLIGMTLDSFAISIVFAKLIRAKHATNTIQFSRNAVISRRNGKLCFMFRVGDLRKSRLAGVEVRAILIRSERTREGETLPNYQTELSLNSDEASSSPLLLWPMTMYHEIDEDSPLFDFVAPELMKRQKIEIIVILDATVESTGVSIEAKGSYLASEILWGHAFEPIISYNKYAECYEADWSKFDTTKLINLQSVKDEDDEIYAADTEENAGQACVPSNSREARETWSNNVGTGCENYVDEEELLDETPPFPLVERKDMKKTGSEYDKNDYYLHDIDEENEACITLV